MFHPSKLAGKASNWTRLLSCFRTSRFTSTNKDNNDVPKPIVSHILNQTIPSRWVYVFFFSFVGLAGSIPMIVKQLESGEPKKIVKIDMWGRPLPEQDQIPSTSNSDNKKL